MNNVFEKTIDHQSFLIKLKELGDIHLHSSNNEDINL